MKKQILIIGGGEVFENYEDYLNYLRQYKIDSLDGLRYQDWKSNLEVDLGGKFEVIYPSMPCKKNADFLEWKIWLEKFFPFLRNDIILIGHSLGGSFWLRYLAENSFPVKIAQLHLVAAPISGDNEFLGSFTPPKDLNNIEKSVKSIYLYQSKDDPVVPFSELYKISHAISSANIVILDNYGHFRAQKFPELIDRINGLGQK